MYGHDDTLREQTIEEYRDDVLKLIKYLPWLASKSGKEVSSMYRGDDKMQVIPIPVYDSTLLAFIKDAEKTKFMDRNYPYVYSRNNIKTHEDEVKLLQSATLADIRIFKGVISKYVLGGRKRSVVWADGVESGVLEVALACLNKLFFSNTKDGSQMLRY